MPVAIEGCRGSLEHRSVELHGVTAGTAPDAGGSFRITIDRVRATLRIRGGARPRLALEKLTFYRPRLTLSAATDAPAPAGPGEAAARSESDRRRRDWLEVGVVSIARGELLLTHRSSLTPVVAVRGIDARLEPGGNGLGLEAAAEGIELRGVALPGLTVSGRAARSSFFALTTAPIEATWACGSLARGTASTASLRADGVQVAGEGRARIEDLAALGSLGGVLARVSRMAVAGVVEVSFRGAVGAGGPRLEVLSARLEMHGPGATSP